MVRTPYRTELGTSCRLDRGIFSDPAVLEQELHRVFRPSWQLLGFSSELPEPGDYVVRRMGADSVIVTRDERGGHHVLLNSCSHRATALCRATFGNAAHHRCSYHGWVYANDGRLVGVPGLRTHYPAGFDKDAHRLPAARVTCYRGFLFATWDPAAPELEEYLGDLRWYLDAMLDLAGGEWEVYGPPQRSLMTGNWKVPTDNFAGDGYHMQTTHQSAFEFGVYGDTLAGGTLGRGELDLLAVNIGTEEGHALRAGYVVAKGEQDLSGRDLSRPVYIGYPPTVWEEFSGHQSAEQIRFNSHCEVLHGVVFPNAAFLSVSHDRAIGRAEDPLTKYVVWRVHNPVDARTTECLYWTLVPRAMTEEWKRRSYAYQARSQSAGGILFEMDDFENFARIDSALPADPAGAPLDLSLGYGLGTPAEDFPGPARAEYITLSEHNQRAFYRRWSHLMGRSR